MGENKSWMLKSISFKTWPAFSLATFAFCTTHRVMTGIPINLNWPHAQWWPWGYPRSPLESHPFKSQGDLTWENDAKEEAYIWFLAGPKRIDFRTAFALLAVEKRKRSDSNDQFYLVNFFCFGGSDDFLVRFCRLLFGSNIDVSWETRLTSMRFLLCWWWFPSQVFGNNIDVSRGSRLMISLLFSLHSTFHGVIQIARFIFKAHQPLSSFISKARNLCLTNQQIRF